MIPEYLNYLLTGVKKKEYTNATTTGLVNAETGEFDNSIISVLGLPKRLFGKLYAPGTSVGMLKAEIAAEAGGQLEVVLCASHDTASAVEGIPMNGNQPYISSGTWSLLGLKVTKAITDKTVAKPIIPTKAASGIPVIRKILWACGSSTGLKTSCVPISRFHKSWRRLRKVNSSIMRI